MGLYATIFWVAIGTWLASSAYCLVRNYRLARKSGLTVLASPFNHRNGLFMIFVTPLAPFLKRWLPRYLYEGMQFTVHGWEFADNTEFHERLGWSVMRASPGGVTLWTGELDLAVELMARTKDFGQGDLTGVFMGFFGENLVTSNGEAWVRHRRIVAPTLNERISNLVWTEALDQSRQMVEYALDQPGGITDNVIDGVCSIAFNVLGFMGYGLKKPWTVVPGQDSGMAYFDAVQTVTKGLVPAAIVPHWIMRLPFMPAASKKLGRAVKNVPPFTADMLERERVLLKGKTDSRGNLMSMLVQLSDQEKQLDGKQGEVRQYLSESEITGNLFMFTVGGYDTTSSVLSFAITVLACYPEWQDWIIEEIDQVLSGDGEEFDYASTFPRLTRCLAIMYETVRIYPPFAHISRQNPAAVTLTSGPRPVYIPAKTEIFINSYAIQTDPRNWGPDARVYRPARFFSSGRPPIGEKLIHPPKGTFMAWAAGPRVCPGQKMSQVEFVGVIATLFRKCRLEPVREPGETMKQARSRFEELLRDAQPVVTLTIKDPKKVVLKWTRR
ncbi:cytochrome P450 [Trichodelitschia bisporula]|uniref:Cytochrome P450 n=1 Tax=Trichodelitschia bisporula TaxID=703511 RepID=A0A6G1I2Z7_9PEZI|nr:cytochrome P450 [Trichodelitschia bisporula]